MALATVVAGPYSGQWNGTSIGQTQDGFRLRASVSKEVVRSDTYGDSAIDAVFRGGDVFALWVGIEYGTAIAPWWPYGSAIGVLGQVGRLDQGSSLTQSLALTATAGTPAASSPATLTGGNSIIDENFNSELPFRTGMRIVPLSMRLYPYTSSGLRFFATT